MKSLNTRQPANPAPARNSPAPPRCRARIARWLCLLCTGGWPTACLLPHAQAAAAQYVIVISVDGMGSAYVTPLLASGLANELTNFKRMQAEGAGTLNARDDYNFAITLPNHVTMMTSRGVYGTGGNGHNWTSNTDPSPTDTIAATKGSYVASGFDVAHDNGLRTGIWSGKSKFSLFQQSYGTTTGALDSTGPDNGRDKIDYDKIVASAPAATLTSDFTGQMTANPFHFVFFHYQDPDATGHASGWSTDPNSPYAVTLKAVDTQLGNVLQMVTNNPTLNGKTAIILTADHGGHDKTHGDTTNPLDYTIPFYVWGPGVQAGGDLYAMNPTTRTAPGATTNPPYTGGQPVRNGDAANLALDLLGLGPVPGSAIDNPQNLVTTVPGVTLGLAGSPLVKTADVATVTATLATTCALDVTVNLAFAGTAAITTDYTRSATSIVIPAGSMSRSISLTAVHDAVVGDAAKTIVVDIDTVVNGTEAGAQQVTATITTLVPVPFTTWMHTLYPALTDPQDRPDADPDGDGLDNAIEYVLGSSPDSANGGGPTGTTDGSDFVFTFQRALVSKDPGTTVVIQVGNNLVDWPLFSTYVVGTAPEVTVTPGLSVDHETVSLRVPRVNAAMFARLRVVIAP